jgi:MinD superfamily P-loop ATPase
MTYMITAECIQCASCKPFCKRGAICEEGSYFRIDETKCDSCGTCAEYCPIDGALVKVETPSLSFSR